MPDSLPGIKRWFKGLGLREATTTYVVGFLVAFLFRMGRMSAAAASTSVRIHPRHRAQVIRFLERNCRTKDLNLLMQMADRLLAEEVNRRGRWVLCIDQTYCTQQGCKTENTFTHGKRAKSGKDRRRRKKITKKSCHCFVMGLLITPSGLRLPLYRSYYTAAYIEAQNKNRVQRGKPLLKYRKQTELAAELVLTAPIPQGVRAVILSDNAFDADVFQEACRQKKYSWIVCMNLARVLKQRKGQRPKVASLVSTFTAQQFAPIKLTPGKGCLQTQQRAAACRVGRKAKTRTFYAHAERLTVQSVGEVQVVFSTMQQPQRGRPVDVQKMLMTNDLNLSAAMIVRLYDLRWQIELFFKELKSTLGFHHYRFRKFIKVERWVELCLITFLYLEWYRAQKLKRKDLSKASRQWWQWQRCHGLRVAMRRETENNELDCIAKYTTTRGGIRKLRKILRAARPLEERCAA